MRTFIISVTQEDIDRGERSDPYYCPVARATQRATGRHAGVDEHTIFGRIENGTNSMFAELPPEAKEFVEDFDMRRPVEPFSFEVSIEERFLR